MSGDSEPLSPEAAQIEANFQRVHDQVALAVTRIMEVEFEACGGRTGVQRVLAFVLAYEAGIMVAGQAASMGIDPGPVRSLLSTSPVKVLVQTAQLQVSEKVKPRQDPTPASPPPTARAPDAPFSFDWSKLQP